MMMQWRTHQQSSGSLDVVCKEQFSQSLFVVLDISDVCDFIEVCIMAGLNGGSPMSLKVSPSIDDRKK